MTSRADSTLSRLTTMLLLLAVFLAAFLLFLVQPLFARIVLPTLGGAPAVWNTSLAFYQLVLLAGYGYAHAVSRWRGRRQICVHLALFALALLFIPLRLNTSLALLPAHPVPWLLLALTASIGLPYFAISATGPLIQHWIASSSHPAARSPYFLFASSNLGSLAGLLAYPLLLEPRLHVVTQARLWSTGFAALLGLVLASALLLCTRFRAQPAAPAPAPAADPDPGAPPWSRRIRWVLLALIPTSLMMGVTSHVTTDVAALPLLWVLPLSVYLATYILMFLPSPPISLPTAAQFQLLLLIPVLLLLAANTANLVLILAVHLAFLFAVGLVCHGRLLAQRPPARHLTVFYLCIAVGGALGGVFNAFLAPRLFSSVAEYPLAIAAACALLPATKPLGRTTPLLRDGLFGLLIAGLILLVGVVLAHLGIPFSRGLHVLLIAALIVPLVAVADRPSRLAIGVAALLLVPTTASDGRGRLLRAARSFYGVNRVYADTSSKYHELVHGTTVHGVQRVGDRTPLGYYSAAGPLGDVYRLLRTRSTSSSVGVVGLGAGGMLAYARPSDAWTIFELDPEVARIATDSTLFTFLRGSHVPIRIILGDARVSLTQSREVFDLLQIDAYSSDAIPLHLFTREALGLYMTHLRPHGVLVMHLSNQFFDLAPIVARLAGDAGLQCRFDTQTVLPATVANEHIYSSEYAVLARTPDDLASLSSSDGWHELRGSPEVPLWTDDFASLLTALRRR